MQHHVHRILRFILSSRNTDREKHGKVSKFSIVKMMQYLGHGSISYTNVKF